VNDEDFMRIALQEAESALTHDDVPVGAAAVADGEVIATAHNERELRRDPTAHAEVLLLQRVSDRLQTWRLSGVTVYVTLEPCPMCAGALVAASVARVVYGAPDPRAGAVYSLYNIVQDPRLSHRCDVTVGVLAEACGDLLLEFFGRRREAPGFP
jgi:tRNA(adenine34) deaminase